uniref:MARVEL domain-containing protein n=1 Tax=Steinernema glaseri TaxID=37863 RepID=A0A1I7YCC2_9BILA
MSESFLTCSDGMAESEDTEYVSLSNGRNSFLRNVPRNGKMITECLKIACNDAIWAAGYAFLFLAIVVGYGEHISTRTKLLFFMVLTCDICVIASLVYGLKNKNHRYMIPSLFYHLLHIVMTLFICFFSAVFIMMLGVKLAKEQKRVVAQFVAHSTEDLEIGLLCGASSVFLSAVYYFRVTFWKLYGLYNCYRYFHRSETSESQQV